MNPRNDVLEANLARLLPRAYRPVVPSDVFRRRVELAVGERVAPVAPVAAAGASGRGLARRRRGPWFPVAAVASLLGLFFSSVWWFSRGPGGSPTVQAIVAVGDVAMRRELDGPWRALGDEEAARGLEFRGPFLEVVTPPASAALAAPASDVPGLEVRVAAASRARLGSGSAARFWRADGTASIAGDWIAELRSGEVRLARSPADAGGELRTPHGRVRLDEGEVLAALVERSAVPADVLARALPRETAPGLGSSVPSETLLRLRLRTGAATLLAGQGEGLALPADEAVWVLDGRPVAGVPASPTPGATARRAAAEPEEREQDRASPGAELAEQDAAPTAAALALQLVAPEPGENTPEPGENKPGALLVTLLREVQLPDVSFPEPHTVQADARGRATLTGLAPGRYVVFVRAEGLATRRFDDVHLVAGETARIEGALERGVTVRGRVVSAVTGEPLEGAVVLNEFDAAAQVLPFADVHAEYGPELVRVATTDAQGRFELPRAGARLLLRATAPGHGPSWVEPRTVSGDVVEGLELALAPAGGVAGVVYREDGTPWDGAELVVAAADMMGRRPCMSFAGALTDFEGRFEVTGLPRGPHAVVLLGSPSSGAAAIPNVVIVDVVPGATTRISLPGGAEQASVFGRLLDARGAAVENLSVSLERLDAGSGMAGWQGARLDADGAYELQGLEPGRYRIGVSADMGGDIVTLEEFELQAGEERLLDLVLPPNELRGRVVRSADEEPVHAVAILLQRAGVEGEDNFVGKVLTARDGSFVFPHVPPGRHVVSAYPSDPELAAHIVGEIAVVPGVADEPLAIALQPGGKIRVEVVDSTGAPVERALVELWDLRGQEYFVSWNPRTDAEGLMLAPSLPAGDFEVRVAHSGYRASRIVARVTAGETATARVELRTP